MSGNQPLSVNIVNNHIIPYCTNQCKEGTLANPKEDPGPSEQANVNIVTTGPVETPSRTYSTTSRTKVALRVVPVKIMSKEGYSVTTYALLDTGSKETFLSKGICNKLGLQFRNCDILAVCTLLSEFSIKVVEANVQVKTVDSRDNRTLAIESIFKCFQLLGYESCRQSEHH